MSTKSLRRQRTLILGIDPSVRMAGYGLCDPDGCVPVKAGILRQESEDLEWRLRAQDMATTLVDEVVRASQGAKLVVSIEVPNNWFTEKGQDSKNDEAVQKLYYTTGAIVAALSNREQVLTIWGIIPSDWKGQTPKPIMRQRCCTYLSDHDYDMPPHMPTDTCEAILLARTAARKGMTNFLGDIHLPEPWSLLWRTGEKLGTTAAERFL